MDKAERAGLVEARLEPLREKGRWLPRGPATLGAIQSALSFSPCTAL